MAEQPRAAAFQVSASQEKPTALTAPSEVSVIDLGVPKLPGAGDNVPEGPGVPGAVERSQLALEGRGHSSIQGEEGP